MAPRSRATWKPPCVSAGKTGASLDPDQVTAMPAPRQKQLAATVALWLTGLLLVLPFTFNTLLLIFNQTIPFFAFHWLATAIGLAAIALLPWAGREHGVRIPYSVLPLLGLIGICLYQWAAPDIPYSAPYITYVTYMVWAIALFALGATLHQSLGAEKLLQTIAWLGLAGALLAAVTGVIQLAGVPKYLQPWIISFDGGHPIGNVRQSNFFSCHIFLGFLALTYLFGIDKMSLRWFMPCAILLLTVLAFCTSRALYLYFVGIICWTAWIRWRNNSDPHIRRILVASIFSFLLFLLLQWGILLQLEDVFGKLTNAATRLRVYEGGFFGRLDVWLTACKIFLQHPISGGGIGNFSWLHFLLTDHAIAGPFGHPHNLFFFYLATTGIIGTALLLLFLLVIVNRLRILRHDIRYWFPSAALLVIFIYSMLEFPLWLPAFLGITAFLCGGLNPAGWSMTMNKKIAKSVYVAAIGICALLLLDTLQDYRKLTKIASGKVSPVVATNWGTDIRNNPWLRPYAERSLLNRITLQAGDQASNLLQLNTRLLRWQPTHGVLLLQPILLSLTDNADESVKFFKEATVRYPGLNQRMNEICTKNPMPEMTALCNTAKEQVSESD